MKYLYLLISVIFFSVSIAQVPTDVPLELRAQFNGQYDYKIIGNSHNEFDNWQNPPPPCQMLTQSSAQLTLNPNQNVVAAYLYWSGIGDGTLNPVIQLNGNNISADQIEVVNPFDIIFAPYFGAVKNVTDILVQEGNGIYTFENLDLNSIIGNYCSSAIYYAGWSILVVYEDNTLPIQQVNVYDGLASVFGNVNNFSTSINIESLNVVSTQDARMGYLAWNGSPNLFFNESVSFNGNLLSNPPLNPIDNPFNSTNSYTGSTDLWNMDLDVFDISNFISVGDTSATLTFTSVASRFIQNVVTVTRSELPDATIDFINIINQDFCDDRNISLEVSINNLESSDILPANTPFSVFVLDANGDEVFLDTFFSQNDIPIDGSESQTVDISIPNNIPSNTTLILKVNTLQDGSNPVNESNVLNNRIDVDFVIPQSPNITNPPIALSVCGNLSASDPVDLTQNDLSSLGLPNPEDFNIQYFTSNSDAQTGDNPIPNPESFVLTSNPQDIFIRVENAEAPACFTLESFTASYQNTPDIQQTINLNQCQENSESMVFDLTTNDATAIGISDPSNTNISYHETLANAQSDSEPILNPANYSPLNNSQTIFIRAENANNPECFSTAGFDINTFTVSINNVNDLNIQACIFPGESVIFDLTENSSLALGNQNADDYSITYYTSESEALSGSNPIPNPNTYENLSDPQAIWIRLENVNSPVNCFLTAEFSISVANAAQINFTPNILQVCDTNNDGFAEFDLSQSIDDITLNNPDISVSFHESQNNAENNINPLSSPFTNTVDDNQTLFFRTEETGNGCSFTGSLDLEVLANPELDMSQPTLSACAVDGNTATFDLTDINDTIILNNDTANFDVAYFLSENEALNNANAIQNPTNYTNTGNPQALWIRVSDDDNCVSVAEFTLDVLTGAVIEDTTIDDVFLCSENPDELLVNFDLTQFDNSINPNPDAETLVVYYAGQNDFNNGNPIENPENFEVNTANTTIIAEVVNVETLCVSPTQVSYDIIVNSLPIFELPETAQICIDQSTGEVINTNFSPPVLDNNLSESAFEFEWFLNGELIENTASNLEVLSAGNYEVIATNISTGCSFSQTTDVEEINLPSFNVDVLSPAFSGDNRVEINSIEGEGEFEFQLDDDPWISLQPGQNSLIFENLEVGIRRISARDTSGCGESTVEFTILGFPPFFTPNADGFNDFWNIRALRNQPNAVIYIFDRYGKLIYKADPRLIGWDGTYQGRQMPAQDYWFRVEFTDPQTGNPAVFTNHFTLKR